MRVMGGQRATKIERFKEQKEYAAKLKELYEHVQKEHVDDEIKVCCCDVAVERD